MKKFLFPTLLASALALSACGKKEEENNGSDMAVIEDVVEMTTDAPAESQDQGQTQMQDLTQPAAPAETPMDATPSHEEHTSDDHAASGNSHKGDAASK